MNLLRTERVDHGVRAIEDPRLVEHLIETQIPLGICPRSNVILGIYDGWSQHPLLRLRDAGVNVTINTDDPGLLGSRPGGGLGGMRGDVWSRRVGSDRVRPAIGGRIFR